MSGRVDSNLTPAVPLGDEFVLEEGLEVACDEHVHVDPHAAVVPDDKQTDKVAVDPCLLVVELQKFARFHGCALGQGGNIDDTDRERLGIAFKIFAHNGVLAQVAVGPEDET